MQYKTQVGVWFPARGKKYKHYHHLVAFFFYIVYKKDCRMNTE